MKPLDLQPPFVPRSRACLSEYALERLRHDELPAERAQRHRRHLIGCPGCRARLRALAEDAPPPIDFAAMAWPRSGVALEGGEGASGLDGAEPPAARPLARRRFWQRLAAAWPAARGPGWPRWVGALGCAAALALAVGFGESGTRRKGAPWELGVIARRASHRTERVLSGEQLRPGERLRFEVAAPSDGFVSVISLDAAGVVTAFVPAAGAALPVAGGQRQLLDGAVALDETPGRERLELVACARPIDVGEVVRAARQRLTAAQGQNARVQDLGLGCQQRSFWIEKVAP
jgi:hypothetical protein